MNPDFTRAAHREAVYAKLVQHLRDNFLNGEAPAKDKILCTKVLYDDAEVSQEAIFEVVERLMELQQREEKKRNQFVLRRRGHEPQEAPVEKRKQASDGEGNPDPAKPSRRSK